MSKYALRFVALGYLSFLILVPVALVLWRTFEHGLGPVWDSLTRPSAVHALWLTILIALIAVPLNTFFGVLCALALVRQQGRGKALLGALLDLPLAVSPVVIGLAMILVYGRNQAIGGWLFDHGIRMIFALPGMVLATIFVSLPFVAREVVPVLREIGTDQEQAAHTLGSSSFKTFWHITLPAIRPAITFGVVLTTARAIGEFGAVSIVSGRLAGRTETLTLHVEERFQAFDDTGAYTSATVLALLALLTLLAMHAAKPKGAPDGNHTTTGE